MSLTEWMDQRFSTQHFLLGVCGVFGLYLVGFGALLALKDSTLSSLSGRLASQSVVIEYLHAGKPKVPLAAVDVSVPRNPPTKDEAYGPAVPVGTLTPDDQGAAPAQESDDLAVLAQEQQTLGLTEAPIDGVYEETAQGLLPKRAGVLTPFEAYRKPFTLNQEKPALAIAVTNLGLSVPLSEQLLQSLPSGVTFVLNPYSADPELWAKSAREDGHEFWIQMMTETQDFPRNDPGAKALMTSVSLKFNFERYLWTLGRAAGYAGVAAFTDTALASAGPMFETVAQDIFKRGLGYLELSSARYSYFESYAVSANSPWAHAQMAIADFSVDGTELKKLDQLIKDNGGAVVVVTPTPSSIAGLKALIERMHTEGVEIVPLSAIASMNVDSSAAKSETSEPAAAAPAVPSHASD